MTDYILNDYLAKAAKNDLPLLSDDHNRSVDSGTLYMVAGGTSDQSTAKQLQPAISKWYKGTRTLALVGLLSVLVYIGIRIIISSSAEDKAKYKKMIGSWVAAVCLVFILHYLMLFILTISDELTDMLSSTILKQQQGIADNDAVMIAFREQIRASNYSKVIAPIICYLVLVIYTAIFTIHYFKRVVYMAFLTMIAPLIALTYPIDKIKDGKAQAFSMWLKEYIFNALIQPVHLLLYYALVGSSITFAKNNILYAIVAIGFLVPAEKFFKKLFGMESQTSVGTLGAAAGGAAVMSMISKMKASSDKQEKEGEKQQANNKNVRTTDKQIQGGNSPALMIGMPGNQTTPTNPQNGAPLPYNTGLAQGQNNARGIVPRSSRTKQCKRKCTKCNKSRYENTFFNSRKRIY